MRPICCAGCDSTLTPGPGRLLCHFATSGFFFSSGAHARPCGIGYHPTCFRAGAPFTSRGGPAGLTFPSITTWPTFICECCTVRAILDRELLTPRDTVLMLLERMRILDIARHWASGTHRQYQGRLNRLAQFERLFHLRVLHPGHLDTPPRDAAIPLMWAHEFETIRPQPRGRRADLEHRLQFNTIRSLRSAVSYFLALDSVIRQPSLGMYDGRRNFLHASGRYTDSAIFSLFSAGLATRIGNDPKPSLVLLYRHVLALDRDLDLRFRAATSAVQRTELATAGFANLTFWLGWLRAREAFNLRWCDVEYLPSLDDLPPSFPPLGALLYRLGPETKSERSRRADVICAAHTRGGFDLARWYHRCQLCAGLRSCDTPYDTSHIFRHPTGGVWTSQYFRTAYLYPLLRTLQAAGDAHLTPFTNDPGNRLEDKIWSMHSYRRGARTHVSKKRGPHHRRATDTQVYEHARWSKRRNGEPVDVQYRDWTYADRIELTYLSM